MLFLHANFTIMHACTKPSLSCIIMDMMYMNLGRFSEEQINGLLSESSRMGDLSERVSFLSGQLLGTDYRESTLIGDRDTPEVFVINLEGVDCFTFIDYVEAMRLSKTPAGFKDNLMRVRYRGGIVSFENRNHFFTDWREFNANLVDDVTGEIGGVKAEKIKKVLNQKEDGTSILPGIQPVQREIVHIPSEVTDGSVFRKLSTGDYIGVYSQAKGLDVSHVGIVIKDDSKIWLRHASAQEKYRKVVDEDFKEYILNKPGIIVLRPNPGKNLY
jgi:N-acetylmuramoyl-L-alanine amidase-like